MGFRKDSYCTVWEIDPKSDTLVRARISINRKSRETGEYEQDFGGFVAFLGTACAQKAARLKPKDRIRLGDVDVTNHYDSARQKEYTNFNIYSFEMADAAQPQAAPSGAPAQQPSPDEYAPSDDLPF